MAAPRGLNRAPRSSEPFGEDSGPPLEIARTPWRRCGKGRAGYGGRPRRRGGAHPMGAIVSLVVSVGAIRISLRLHDGGSASVRDLFAVDGPLFWRYFLASVLYSLIVAVGFILLIVPGVIFSVRYVFYGYAVVERNARP